MKSRSPFMSPGTYRKLLCVVLLAVFISGCRTSLKSNWKDFNAYYNTFYNARQNYQLGLNKNLEQPREYNPVQPIRIHEEPVNAGAEDFNRAIEKGASILRDHSETRWVDDALALIGKSYYFRKEYYSADQKFKELFNTTRQRDMKQEAIIWQGRVLLDMGLNGQGISYLQDELLNFEGWDDNRRAEAQAILAQHYVSVQNWDLAREQLLEALPKLKPKEYKERGYFMLGQIYERLGDDNSAFEAYKEVEDHYTEYRLQYLAKRKQAEMARNLNRNEVAYSIFDEMVRDDKNTEYQSELDFELGRTEQQRGNFERAELMYNDLLHNDEYQPSPEISARAYYSLAEIYRFEYDDFRMASAYYDSASQMNADPSRLPEDFQATELARSFGEYTRIQNEISLQDSLLHLGQLSPTEFDSAMVELRQQRRLEMERLRELQESQDNRMVNVNAAAGQGNQTQAGSSSNGFLNIRNQSMVDDARAQFRAIWGGRPLADNWRVAALIESASSARDGDNVGDGELTASGDGGVMEIQIDTSNIPFSETAQDSVRKIISEFQYELGNLFFINLNMPDSASRYYQKAINSTAREEVRAVSLYSLSELESIAGNQDLALGYARRLADEFPESVYARRLADQFDLNLESTIDSTAVDTLMIYQQIEMRDSLSVFEKADAYRSFAGEYQGSSVAARAQFDAIQLYIAEGRQDSLFDSRLNTWNQLMRNREQEAIRFEQYQDSLQTVLSDTTLTLSDSLQTRYRSIVDSTFTDEDLTDFYPYTGEAWDLARMSLDEFLERFPQSPLRQRAEFLNEELELPESLQSTEGEEESDSLIVQEGEPMSAEADSLQADSTLEQPPATADSSVVSDSTAIEQEEPENALREGYIDCRELGVSPEIRGGKDQIMQTVRIQAGQLPENLPFEDVTYRFYINQRGALDDYTLVTEEVPEKLQTAFAQTFNGLLSFQPVMSNGSAIPVQCEVSFAMD